MNGIAFGAIARTPVSESITLKPLIFSKVFAGYAVMPAVRVAFTEIVDLERKFGFIVFVPERK